MFIPSTAVLNQKNSFLSKSMPFYLKMAPISPSDQMEAKSLRMLDCSMIPAKSRSISRPARVLVLIQRNISRPVELPNLKFWKLLYSYRKTFALPSSFSNPTTITKTFSDFPLIFCFMSCTKTGSAGKVSMKDDSKTQTQPRVQRGSGFSKVEDRAIAQA